MTVSRHHRLKEAVAPTPRDRSLVEMMRVMDVAREIRKSHQPAEQALVDGEFRNQLRENLLRTARESGDPVSEADVDAAIARYVAHRHVYNPPRRSFRLLLAHLWVLRRWMLLAAGSVIIGVALLWLLSLLFAASA